MGTVGANDRYLQILRGRLDNVGFPTSTLRRFMTTYIGTPFYEMDGNQRLPLINIQAATGGRHHWDWDTFFTNIRTELHRRRGNVDYNMGGLGENDALEFEAFWMMEAAIHLL